MTCKKRNKLNRLIWQEFTLYACESLLSLWGLFGQEERHVSDKRDSVPNTAHTGDLKRADKGGWKENGGNSREHEDTEGQGIQNLGGWGVGRDMVDVMKERLLEYLEQHRENESKNAAMLQYMLYGRMDKRE